MSKRARDYYQILQVNYDATPRQIQAAYYALREKFGDDRTQMREIREAYSRLSDPISKARYDKEIHVSALRVRSKKQPPRQHATPAKTEILTRDPGPAPQENRPGTDGPPLARTEILSGTADHVLNADSSSEPYSPFARTEILSDIPHLEKQPVPESGNGSTGQAWHPDDQTQIHTSIPIIPALLNIDIPGEPPRVQALGLGRTTIGRKEDNDVVLPDPQMFISRHHAYIVAKPDGYYVVDNQSGNGTRLQGKPIPPQSEIRLSSGDTIEIEGRKLTFRLGSPGQ